jgi:quercetin dioxygenase-like cupin family protein
MKCVGVVAFACTCLVLPASAQQVVKQLLPTPPKGDQLEARLVTATIEPGAVGKWHTYPTHPVVYVAEGTVTVEFRDGPPRVYNAGEGFVEPINTILRGRNKGRTPVKLVIFQLSPPDVPDAIDAPSQ